MKEVLEELLEQERKLGHGDMLKMFAVPQPALPIWQELFVARMTVEPDRSNWDYLYLAKNLIELPGKAYHGKRNHIAKFRRLYEYSYEDITEQNAWELSLIHI